MAFPSEKYARDLSLTLPANLHGLPGHYGESEPVSHHIGISSYQYFLWEVLNDQASGTLICISLLSKSRNPRTRVVRYVLIPY